MTKKAAVSTWRGETRRSVKNNGRTSVRGRSYHSDHRDDAGTSDASDDTGSSEASEEESDDEGVGEKQTKGKQRVTFQEAQDEVRTRHIII